MAVKFMKFFWKRLYVFEKPFVKRITKNMVEYSPKGGYDFKQAGTYFARNVTLEIEVFDTHAKFNFNCRRQPVFKSLIASVRHKRAKNIIF